MPEWLFGQLTNGEANDLLASGPGVSDGRFLVRTRSSNEHVLSVVYKGKGTHHLIRPGENGFLLVNKKQYGESRTIEELVETLRGSCKGWPVRLTTFPSNNKSNEEASENSEGGENVDDPEWLHNEITREEAEGIVKENGQIDGQFLVRKREGHPGQFVLCVVYKSKPTHHLIAKNDDGNYCINKRVYGTGATDVVSLIAVLQQPNVAGWPVQLTQPLSRTQKVTSTDSPLDHLTKTESVKSESQPPIPSAEQAAEERIAKAEQQLADKPITVADEDTPVSEPQMSKVKDHQSDPKGANEEGGVEAIDAPNTAEDKTSDSEIGRPTHSSPTEATDNDKTQMDTDEDDAVIEQAQERLAEIKAASAAAAAAAAVKQSKAAETTQNDHAAARLMPPLPEGWRMVPSRSNPGEFVYENINTLERQAWRPTEPAALSVGQLKAAVAANDMERQLAQRRLSEIHAMQHLAVTTSSALSPEQENRRAMDLLIQQQQYQLETEQRAHAKLLAQAKMAKKMHQEGKTSGGKSKRNRRSPQHRSFDERSSISEERTHKSSQKLRLQEAEQRLREKEAELLGLTGTSQGARRLSKKVLSSRANVTQAQSSVKVVSDDGLYVTTGGHVDRSGTFSHV